MSFCQDSEAVGGGVDLCNLSVKQQYAVEELDRDPDIFPFRLLQRERKIRDVPPVGSAVIRAE